MLINLFIKCQTYYSRPKVLYILKVLPKVYLKPTPCGRSYQFYEVLPTTRYKRPIQKNYLFHGNILLNPFSSLTMWMLEIRSAWRTVPRLGMTLVREEHCAKPTRARHNFHVNTSKQRERESTSHLYTPRGMRGYMSGR